MRGYSPWPSRTYRRLWRRGSAAESKDDEENNGLIRLRERVEALRRVVDVAARVFAGNEKSLIPAPLLCGA